MTVVDEADERGSSSDTEAPRTKFEDHQRTFDAFLGLIRWGVIGSVVLLLGLAYFLL